ncbi:hypothetical protein LSH36_156g07039 [Paralvinella palmiformis]|uniref:Uncharacterized protein n=1 Tax=Paralvinella palmiformis TaxID=53620 RepID=A0AAD9JV23_9ANNE|nr:hypothetical protein LSH36_156g07039 [Paralvinella palmiformis]
MLKSTFSMLSQRSVYNLEGLHIHSNLYFHTAISLYNQLNFRINMITQ